MRGEVVLLTRNIVIEGDMTENDWPGQFVTSDAIQIDLNGVETNLQGLTVLDQVELVNMGQTNTAKAALRFDHSSRSLTDPHSSVTNCVIRDSGAWGIHVYFSSNINVSNTDVWSPR